MKKDVQYRQITKEVVRYIADDGTEFESEEQCKAYEKTAKHAINMAFKSLNHTECSGGRILDNGAPFAYDGTLYVVHIRDANDLDIINKWVLSINNRSETQCVPVSYIGKTVVLDKYYDDVWFSGTIEEIIERFKDTVESLLSNKTQEEK